MKDAKVTFTLDKANPNNSQIHTTEGRLMVTDFGIKYDKKHRRMVLKLTIPIGKAGMDSDIKINDIQETDTRKF